MMLDGYQFPSLEEPEDALLVIGLVNHALIQGDVAPERGAAIAQTARSWLEAYHLREHMNEIGED